LQIFIFSVLGICLNTKQKTTLGRVGYDFYIAFKRSPVVRYEYNEGRKWLILFISVMEGVEEKHRKSGNFGLN
jgi:hypothetical protein